MINSRHRMGVGILLVMAATAALWVLLAPSRVTLAGQALAALTLVAGLAPGVAYLAAGSGRLPVLPAIGLFYALFFALPVFLVDVIWPPGQPLRMYYTAPAVDSLDGHAMGLVFLGVGLTLGIAWIGDRWLCPRVKPLRLPAFPDRWLPLVAWGALALHFAYLLVPAVARITSLGQLAQPCGLIGFGLLLVLALRGKVARWQWLAAFGLLLPLRFTLGVMASSVASAVTVLAFLALILAALRPRLTLIGGAFIVLLIAASYKPIHNFRQMLWAAAPAGETQVSRSELMLRALGGTFTRTADTQGDVSVLKRIAQVAVFAMVVEKTPETVPYWGGATIKPLLTSWIPRPLWPSKPKEQAGNAFGHRYEMLWKGDFETSVNLPWLTEFYVNFGTVGLGLGMSLVGLVLAGALALLNRPDATGPMETVVGGVLLFPFVFPESNISLCLGSLLSLALVIWLGCAALNILGRRTGH